MTIKRTELEILDMAISLAENKEKLKNKLENAEKLLGYKCRVACDKKPKNDIEELERKYERKLEDLRDENEKQIEMIEIQKQIIAEEKSIGLLRWLYQDLNEEIKNENN